MTQPDKLIGNQERRMAAKLGLDPYNDDTMPLDVINRLIALEEREGGAALHIEIMKMMGSV